MKTLDQVDPRTPIGPATTPGDGSAAYVITESGSYYLTGNVSVSSDVDGIRVDASNVTIDLMGFTLQGPGGAGEYGVACTGGGVVRVRIRNGVVTGWERGIDASSQCVIEDIKAFDCGVGIRAEDKCFIRNCTALQCFSGVSVGSRCIIDCCKARDCEGTGINAASDGIVRTCVADHNGSSGIAAPTPGLTVDCTANQNMQRGIWFSTGIALRCSTDGNMAGGVRATNGSLTKDCAATTNDGFGFEIGNGSQITGCIAAGNAGDGILATDHSLITGNTVHLNGSGIVGGSDCLVAGNTSSGHPAGFGVRCVDSCRVTDNLCNDNALGISAIRWATIERNTVAGNFTGIATGESCRISDNNAEGNTNNGIEVADSESLIEGNRVSNNLGTGLLIYNQRNLIIRNINRASTQSYDIAANNRVGFTIIPPLSGAISGDSDPDALGAGTTDPWANFSH